MAEIARSLGFNVTIFFAQVVLFLALWFFMGNFFFKPILGRIKQRDKDIADTYHTVQEMQHEMEALRADYIARIAAVEAEARGRIQTAIKEAQSERERILAEARVQSEQTLQQGIEFGAFAVIGVLMGVLGTAEMAAHQIALNIASLTFMVPLGVGAAAAVRVGHAAGAGDAEGARESARAAIVSGVGFMACTAIVFLLMPGIIAAMYTTDVPVGALAAALIPVAGVFQVFDGAQAVCAGVLRGIGDTKAPFFINLAGFWLVGLPVSIGLGFHTRLGAVGLWWGFVAGLAAVAALLLLRVRNRMRGAIARTHVEADIMHFATDP